MKGRLRNRSPQRARSSTRRSGQWSPAYLGLYVWYDANIGGSSTQITDSSGNARAAATVGGGSNSPQWLPYTVPSLHLEAATAGTNSLSCTAPAGTASYSAVPRDGGAPTTAAASSGAFVFTTAGDWASVSLLNAGATEVAKFSAASSTKTGHTDTYGVAWTINRGTSGRKAVIQSPAANSARSLLSFANDDYLSLPLAAIPPMTSSDTFSHYLVVRRFSDSAPWTYPLGVGQIGSGLGAGVGILHNAATNDWKVNISSGASEISPSAMTAALGTIEIVGMSVTPTTITGHLNSVSTSSVSRAGAGDTTPAAARVGSASDATAYDAFEFVAYLNAARQFMAAERALLAAYYGGGL